MDIQNLLIWIRIFLYISIGILIWWIWYVHIIVVEMTNDKKYEGLLFSILNALILGMYLNACGFGFNSLMGKNYIKFLAFCIVIWLIIQGFGYWGLSITFNVNHLVGFRLLRYKTYESSSDVGIFFVVYNLWIFGLIYFASFIFESEVIL